MRRLWHVVVHHDFGAVAREVDAADDDPLHRLRGLLAGRMITLGLSGEARELLAKRGYDPVYGARPLKRAIQQWVQDPLALALLRGDFGEGDTIVADVRDGQIIFHRPGEDAVVDAEFRAL